MAMLFGTDGIRGQGAVPDPDDAAQGPRGGGECARPWSSQKHLVLVTCAKGIPPCLKTELEAAGFPILGERVAGIETECTLEECMRLNLTLRTGQRVFLLLQSFEATHPDVMYRRVNAFPWEEWLAGDGYLSVHSAVSTPTIRDGRFANLRCKDAIVDRMRERCGRRPDSGSAQDRFVVFLYWRDRQCRVYLDTSGEPLARRTYRKNPWKAPMQETLAAAVVMATGWDRRLHFVNPMCGSGTLAIEAALMALNRPPALRRTNFGFMHVAGFPGEKWDRLRREAERASLRRPAGRIAASDVNPHAVGAARQNARLAGVEEFIEFAVCDFAATPLPPGGGVVVMNPEYGARLGQESELRTLYARIGDFFKQNCQGRTGYVFTGNLDLAKTIGLRTSRRITFFNGEIECRLLQFNLYEGTRRKFGGDWSPCLSECGSATTRMGECTTESEG